MLNEVLANNNERDKVRQRSYRSIMAHQSRMSKVVQQNQKSAEVLQEQKKAIQGELKIVENMILEDSGRYNNSKRYRIKNNSQIVSHNLRASRRANGLDNQDSTPILNQNTPSAMNTID